MRNCGNCGQDIPPETDHYEGGLETVYCTDCVERVPVPVIHFYLDGEFMGSDEGDGDIQFIDGDEDEFEIDPLEDVPDGQISIFEEAAE